MRGAVVSFGVLIGWKHHFFHISGTEIGACKWRAPGKTINIKISGSLHLVEEVLSFIWVAESFLWDEYKLRGAVLKKGFSEAETWVFFYISGTEIGACKSRAPGKTIHIKNKCFIASCRGSPKLHEGSWIISVRWTQPVWRSLEEGGFYPPKFVFLVLIRL